MYSCKNCLTTSETHLDQCPKCKMKGMMVQDNTVSIKPSTSHHKCRNCGTHDAGQGATCRVCNFPIQRTEPTIEVKRKVN